MSRYGTVSVTAPTSLITRVVQSASPADLASRVNAAIAALPAGYLVTAITLAGAGDGHTFVVTIEAGATADTVGGFTAAPSVLCYLAADAAALAAARAAVQPAAGSVVDSQSAGASKGSVFMGMLVLGTLAAASAGSIVQADWAQLAGVSILTPIDPYRIIFTAPDGPPVLASLDNVTPGNVIDVTWDLCVLWDDADPAIWNAKFRAVVSFLNAPAFPLWGDDYVELRNSQASIDIPSGPFLLSAKRRCAFIQPPGESRVRVGVAYNRVSGGPNDGLIQGPFADPEPDTGTGINITVTEYRRASVPRDPPGQLVAIPAWSAGP